MRNRLISTVKNHPLYVFRKLIYFVFGNTIGRIAYPPHVFKSKYFAGVSGWGWQWVTQNFFSQRIFGKNSNVPWPCSPTISISNPKNIHFDIDDLNNFQTTGTYYQSFGKIFIGKGTFIAQNVGLITENHDLYNPEKRAETKNITIGEKCWLGMNSVILPGVILGSHTVVGAGSIVTKSFPEGNCVIAGNPARFLKPIK